MSEVIDPVVRICPRCKTTRHVDRHCNSIHCRWTNCRAGCGFVDNRTGRKAGDMIPNPKPGQDPS